MSKVPVTYKGHIIGVVDKTKLTDSGLEIFMNITDPVAKKDLDFGTAYLNHLSIFGPSEADIELQGDPVELDKLAAKHLRLSKDLLDEGKDLITQSRDEYSRYIHLVVSAQKARIEKEQQ